MAIVNYCYELAKIRCFRWKKEWRTQQQASGSKRIQCIWGTSIIFPSQANFVKQLNENLQMYMLVIEKIAKRKVQYKLCGRRHPNTESAKEFIRLLGESAGNGSICLPRRANDVSPHAFRNVLLYCTYPEQGEIDTFCKRWELRERAYKRTQLKPLPSHEHKQGLASIARDFSREHPLLSLFSCSALRLMCRFRF